MLKRFRVILFVLIAVIIFQLTVFATETKAYTVAIGGEFVKTELNLTLKDLKEMPEEAQISQEYIYNSKSGEKTAQVKGVSLAYLLKDKAGVTAEEGIVIFTASDGYEIDPQPLQDIFNDKLKFVLAYEVNGEIIDNDEIENEEITVYRNLKEEGEFNTVYKMINKITIEEDLEEVVEEEPEEVTVEETDEKETETIIFTDITEEFKFAETAIYDLVNRDIIDGMGDGLYAPEKEFTREQFCKIIVAALGYELKDYEGAFSDIDKDRWSSSYVQAAVESGLFIGNPDGTFMPEKVISRQEIAVVAARAAIAKGLVEQTKVDKFVMEKSNYIDKNDVAEWAENAVAYLETQDVFVGVAGENFEPLKNVNRAEAALIVFNTLFSE
ncbi:S-layer homology domain-containing protein [Sedimentibacter sp. MB31-C6]|uniref:S-layer homology domain-containing protein n=1 Tax=Sedimentibacter sp. MB31-C6 TaxID=3109366 RepID=UPI002DDCCED3|nr:S-layer homology domain-containing protein [Sedimentibacter sp. MB36-C1]WSI02919.1 S-layer homology domain-containing protein [Sedimentibacter sp. MB36-C1]